LVVGTRDGGATADAARRADVGEGARVAVIAHLAGLRWEGRRGGAVARSGVALVVGAGDGGAAADPARRAYVVVGARAAIIARLAGLGRYRAARGAVARSGVALVVGAGDGGAAADPARRAYVVVGARAAIIARLAGL